MSMFDCDCNDPKCTLNHKSVPSNTNAVFPSSTVPFPGQIVTYPPYQSNVIFVQSTPKTFEQELTSLINRFSKENDSNTPDFILAEYMLGALNAFTQAVVKREEWYGRKVFRYGSAPQNVEEPTR